MLNSLGLSSLLYFLLISLQQVPLGVVESIARRNHNRESEHTNVDHVDDPEQGVIRRYYAVEDHDASDYCDQCLEDSGCDDHWNADVPEVVPHDAQPTKGDHR